jgi:ribonuclease P protein component
VAPEPELLARPVLVMPRPGDGEIISAPAATRRGRGVARLKKRADFLAAAKGRRLHQPCFALQARERPAEASNSADDAPRFGFTVTKKVAGAVARNRIRRRLREAARLADSALVKPRHDYVLVARIQALTAPFEQLRGELARGLSKINAPDRRKAGGATKDGKRGD